MYFTIITQQEIKIQFLWAKSKREFQVAAMLFSSAKNENWKEGCKEYFI
jgi:hypothetical protein